MIIVAATGDTHADETSRFDEHQRVMDWCASDFAARGVDLVLHGGDVFEATSTPREREFVADWTQRVATGCPIVFAAGNHDRSGDIAYLARLRSRFEIIADERPAVHVVAGVAVATLPWPRKAYLLAALGREASPEESGVLAADALRDIVRGFGLELEAHGGPRVLLAHAMVDGARTNHDQPLIGLDMSVSAADLALARPHFVVASHVHAENEWSIDGTPVVYTTSPLHQNFGESGPTSYLLIRFEDDGRLISWERVATPARQMLLFEAAWDVVDGVQTLAITSREFPHANVLPGAEARLRYSCAADQREAARAAAQKTRDDWLAAGAHSVKLEERVLTTMRARAPEIARAKTTADKLEAYWAATGKVPDEARRASLLAKLSDLEAQS